MLIKTGLLALAMLWGAPAAANSIYKCVSGGRITYSNTYCKRGSMTEMQVKSGPRNAAREAQRAQRQAQVAATTRKNRLALEAAEMKKGSAGNAAAAGRARRCAMRQFDQRQAERKIDAALSSEREKIREQVARQRARLAIECPM